MKKLLTILLLMVSAYLIYISAIDLYEIYFAAKPMVIEKAAGVPPPPPMSMEAGPLKVAIDEATPWSSIVKLLSTILGTYLGIRVINKYIV